MIHGSKADNKQDHTHISIRPDQVDIAKFKIYFFLYFANHAIIMYYVLLCIKNPKCLIQV